jgi:hypothetical protein
MAKSADFSASCGELVPTGLADDGVELPHSTVYITIKQPGWFVMIRLGVFALIRMVSSSGHLIRIRNR